MPYHRWTISTLVLTLACAPEAGPVDGRTQLPNVGCDVFLNGTVSCIQ